MNQLRFITAGSVDDGKSTLIGRLLFDSQSLFSDQVNSIRNHAKGDINFANLTDGLRAEREQGITIDVAYRYFASAKRRFRVADAPGHVRYTRNMFTAASSSDLSVILVDATKGITEQTRRHTYLSSLLGIPHAVVCVNKMDLVGYSEQTFAGIRQDFIEFGSTLHFKGVEFIPVAALHGDNLVSRSKRMPWYSGKSLLEHLEDVDVSRAESELARFPVQWIINSDRQTVSGKSHFRGYAGQIMSGRFAVGDEVLVLPARQTTRIKSIQTFDGQLDCASAPLSVTILLDDELDVGRGDMLVHEHSAPFVHSAIEAIVCWMDEEPLRAGRLYSIKQSARRTRIKVSEVKSRLDINTLQSSATADHSLRLNDIGQISFTAAAPLVFDSYGQSRSTGSFIIVDESTNATAGAGLLLDPTHGKDRQVSYVNKEAN